jgi:hypothetical protein
MRKLLAAILFLPFSLMAEPNISDGKLLYEESCAKCHGTDYYQGLGMSEPSDSVELTHWVDTCSQHFNLDWNNQDIEDTVHYLGRKFFELDR